MNVEIGTEAPIFLFWEYLFQIFGILSLQCEVSEYVIIFWELRGLSPNFHIDVSVSDLYIPRIGPHISCSRIGRSIMRIYKSLTDT